MPKKFRAIWQWLRRPEMSSGKVTLVTALTAAIVSTTTLFAYFNLFVPLVDAANVQTSLTVLNTPPVWTVNAREDVASATSTPTNAGTTLTFKATGTDSNNDNYYLLICSNNNSPTPHSNTAPTCGSGALQWAVSGATTSGTPASAATTTINTFPFDQESNVWYGWICDGNPSGPQCNTLATNSDPTDSPAHSGSGTGYPDSNSPFVINHAPVFFSLSNSGSINPGSAETWTAVATDTDKIRGGDSLKIVVCKASGLVNTIYCNSSGTWATSTAVASNNPNVTIATTTSIGVPFPDSNYSAFVYLYDNNNLVATAGTTSLQGSSSSFVVNNVAPVVSNVAIATTTGNIVLVNPHATSGPFYIVFTVTDNNSCQNVSAGNEIVSATSTLYESGVGLASCQRDLDYNTNRCYPSVATDTALQYTCAQDTSGTVTGNGCSGTTDSTVNWYCKTNIWYNANPTDATAKDASQIWQAAAQVVDDNFATSSEATSTVANSAELDQFLAYNVSTTSIAYGGLQPGQNTSPFVQTTDLNEWGNTGIDESLYGDTMCTTWTSADSCDTGGPDATKKIPVNNQQLSTSSVNYSGVGAYALGASTSPYELHINVPKTIATSTAQTKNTFWGILVPSAITVSGSYTGQDTIIAVTSSTTVW